MITNRIRTPMSTYRLQFNAGFRFADARNIAAYLYRLGISDIYASPIFKARSGSLHGYDILEQNSINPEIGTVFEFDGLVEELHRLNMGLILDIVPNHMCVEGPNPFWLDLLENGPSSSYSSFFDIDWHPVKHELANKVLLPILGDQYGTVLENGELSLSFEEGSFFVSYYEHKLPVVPKTYNSILTCRLNELEQLSQVDDAGLQELLSIITALKHLPPPTEMDPERIAERYREKEIIKRRLWSLYRENQVLREFIDANVALFNGTRGEPASFNRMDALLREQVYRISHWRVATEEINYRRFFDINSLGAIRMEDPDVFNMTHQLIFSLIADRKITGLRIDHADGLLNPAEYLHRLQMGCFVSMHRRNGELSLQNNPADETTAELLARYDLIVDADKSYKPFYIVSEKILLKSERLPDDWPVFGTTGYDFANQVNGIFVDTANARKFETLYTRFLQHRIDLPDVVYQKKKLVMQVAMSSEVNTLGHYLNIISEQNRHTRDFTLNSLIKSIVEFIACFPVYRTYTSSMEVSDRDRQYIDTAVGRAKRLNPAINASVFDFIRDVLMLRFPTPMPDEQKTAWLDFVKRFQQITGPVMAKGVEDTAFYLYNRLVSLNEVGGSPERFGISLEAFHGQNIERVKSRLLAMLASSTHDTKRSEDVRARINVLSEIPDLWREAIGCWGRQNRRVKMVVDGKPAPSRNEEYLLYQTLIGTWPFCATTDEEFAVFRNRIKAYMLKAMREAKVHTSWINPNTLHEDAVMYFIDTILKDSPRNGFIRDFATFQQVTATCGVVNSLAQTLLKITSPGIPDFYQGNELWDFSLVDPDNRRPVDFDVRIGYLQEIQQMEAENGILATARQVAATIADGRIKLYLTYKALNFRRENLELFEVGRYLPHELEGSFQECVCAFERSKNDSSVLVVVPRFCSRLLPDGGTLPLGGDVWQDTSLRLPFEPVSSCYRNVLTGETLTVVQGESGPLLYLKDILAQFPVALLERSVPSEEATAIEVGANDA